MPRTTIATAMEIIEVDGRLISVTPTQANKIREARRLRAVRDRRIDRELHTLHMLPRDTGNSLGGWVSEKYHRESL